VGTGLRTSRSRSARTKLSRMPKVLLLDRLIEGAFPNYEQVVPKANPTVKVGRAAVMAALRSVRCSRKGSDKPASSPVARASRSRV